MGTSLPLPPFLKASGQSKARQAAVVSRARRRSSPEWGCHSSKGVRRCLHGETVQNRESGSKRSGTVVPPWSSPAGDIGIWSERQGVHSDPQTGGGYLSPSEFMHAAGGTGSGTTQEEEVVPKGTGPTHACSTQAWSEGHPQGHGGSLERGIRAWSG